MTGTARGLLKTLKRDFKKIGNSSPRLQKGERFVTRTTRILAALALLLSGVGQATAGPVSSSLSLQADSNAGAGTVTDTDSQSQGATINTLSASVLALAVNGNASVQTSGTGLATWTNPNVGQVVLSDVGWTAVNVGVGSAFLTSGLDYSYTFTADATGTFLLNYDITATGSDTFGLNGFNYDFSGNGAFFVVGTSGTITESVIAGILHADHEESGQHLGGWEHVTPSRRVFLTSPPLPASPSPPALPCSARALWAWPATAGESGGAPPERGTLSPPPAVGSPENAAEPVRGPNGPLTGSAIL
ncbi:MAG: hypothetical protein U0797_29105 [Gemmataceae bacterium]